MNQNHNELIEQINSLKDQLKKKAFDKEEQDLINDVCERVGKIIERIQTNEQLKGVAQANSQVRSAIKDRYRFQNIIGMSPAMQNVYDQILTAAKSDANVSIYGASGTGKELVARAIHDMSPRNAEAFVTINCGAIPEPLMESEFFGYKKGAFTGATFDKHGYLDLADTGTLFLDEIGDLPVNMQVKLLRAIDGGGYYPIGSQSKHASDFRIVAATNKNLKQLVDEGFIREDFYYRIQVIPIFLPPLKDRKEDIPLLVDHFTDMYAQSSSFKKVPNHITTQIRNHDWPGNIRELQNVLLRFFSTGEFDISNRIASSGKSADVNRSDPIGDNSKNLSHAIEMVEKEQIINALQSTNGHRSYAAKKLGISRSTLFRRMKKHGLILKQNVQY
jgi:transcriptional regulator with PAS, ATPase and Fis domain